MLQTARQPMTEGQRRAIEARRGGRLRRALSRVIAGHDWDAALQRDIDGGEVERLVVTVERLATGESRGDEGPILFCDTDDGVVCLVGQWIFDPHVVPDELADDAEDVWFKEFSLVRAPASGVVFELAAASDALIRAERELPAAVIPALPESSVLSASLVNLEQALRSNP